MPPLVDSSFAEEAASGGAVRREAIFRFSGGERADLHAGLHPGARGRGVFPEAG